MNHDQEPEGAVVRPTAGAVGRHVEGLLADGTAYAWTEPPFGETYHSGEDDPHHNPIRDCPAVPRAFRMSCAARAACRPCTCPPWEHLTFCLVEPERGRAGPGRETSAGATTRTATATGSPPAPAEPPDSGSGNCGVRRTADA
ncbi:hypothetical protein FRZ03_09060 [Streptomyces misionensis]|uniref:Uncharacterized protein n=1 Tax=Streptomyces misionensis TaxID=67331 RepID=A0A5C6JWT1_9ACTN|nr:hypothetical protein FRZ03_09060 [Streptomyces misionensis]